MKHILLIKRKSTQAIGPFDDYDTAMEYWATLHKAHHLTGFAVECLPIESPDSIILNHKEK